MSNDGGENLERGLAQIRQDIDQVDAQLIDLLSRRVRLAQEVGALKGLDGQPFFTPERERQIYDRLAKLDADPLRPEQLVAIFREIISAARAAEKPLGIAYWGPPGTFTHLAAIETFGRSVNLIPVGSIQEIFLAVERKQADYGIVPIENSTAGVVPETLDMFPQTNVKICAETFINVHHHLASTAGSLGDIKHVYAGPQPASQCRFWLKEHLPNADIVDVVPTSRAGEKAKADPHGAAIVNALAVELLGLGMLAEHIEDNANNRTRFVVLGFNEPAQSGSDKTSLMFNLRNRPGELYKVLGSFLAHNVNLMMIESRPAQRASFEYIFYVDCAGHRLDGNVEAAIAEIRDHALETVILGSYPSSDPSLKFD